MFTRKANYLGVIKAGSDSVVGFEVAGVLTDLPATEGMRVSPGDSAGPIGYGPQAGAPGRRRREL